MTCDCIKFRLFNMAAPCAVFVFLLSFLCCSFGIKNIPYKEQYYTQTVDHFTFTANSPTFQQRYLIQDQWFDGTGPIFFYTGNEGPITAFWDNTGFMFDIAPQFKALVIFAEHRYYGKSLPFGDDSFTLSNVRYLTIEQAMADYATLVPVLKKQMNATNSPVIAFGGSYGGMLAAYMRFKYPNVIAGSIAGSAPIYLTAGLLPPHVFFQDATKDFHDINPSCPKMIQDGFSAIEKLANQGLGGLIQLSKQMNLCQAMSSDSDFRLLQLWARNAFVYIAMLDYPYPTSFMTSGMPGYPVKVACKKVSEEADPIQALRAAAEIYYNITGASPYCHNLTAEYIPCADPTGCGLGDDSKAWDYQACTEVYLGGGSTGTTDMFPEIPYTEEMRTDYCQKKWGVTPRSDWLNIQMWGKDIKAASKIVFSNGLLDPWHRGGVLTNLTDTLHAVVIPGGAHHLDLRGHNPLDPPSVVAARQFEVDQIRKWVAEWRSDDVRAGENNQ